MQALDTTIANVALPYMQGSLSASLDQINWVLTSYIVTAAIMTAPIGWISDRFGRKRLFIVCAAGFTAASALCGFAQNIEQMVVFRLLQGAFGAALVPLSQAVLLDTYPPQQRGSAMAIWGVGVMLGPIMGPTLGAWLTDNYNWRWVFFINLPIGLLTVVGLLTFMQETTLQHDRRFDRFGFLALAVGIGALQLMLDRGEQLDWFQSSEIVAEAIAAATGFYFFVAHSLTTATPFVRLDLFRNRDFLAGCMLMAIIGVVLFGTMALVTPFLQNVSGYPIKTIGVLLATRGIGTLTAMALVGRLLTFVEARHLVLCGLALTAFTLNVMSGFTDQTASKAIVTTSIEQGFGLGLVFVPLSTAAFATLPQHLRTEGAAILTLVRNVGSSIGISAVIAQLTSMTTANHARLAEFVTPFNDALQALDVVSLLDLTTAKGRAMTDQLVTEQAAIIAYANDFKQLTYLMIATIPLSLLVGPSRTSSTTVTRGSAETN
ncbi:DHA2 family efflux MFS transporter permease subunit [Methylosinus sp. PW1]|uniref:DHA2 family efflux MFS transporter permease subunit n=1 Tax=Methylosinus sp. PW1 TaxID=107636 RepID=UPI000691444A|nr:DHA2 family efflux MFS transporter permease subunit [Methylosinus sp. PW1]